VRYDGEERVKCSCEKKREMSGYILECMSCVLWDEGVCLIEEGESFKIVERKKWVEYWREKVFELEESDEEFGGLDGESIGGSWT